MEQEKFDGILYTMVQNAGGYEGFFDIVFGFLSRKTDFFQNVKKAEEVLAAAGIKFIKQSQEKKSKETPANAKKKEEFKTEVKKQETAAPEVKKEVKTEAKVVDSQKQEEKKEEAKTTEDGKLLPNSGNGSQTDSYKWTQTLNEVQISIPIPSHLRSRDLLVEINQNNVKIATKNNSNTYIQGNWFDKIHPDESLWTIEEANGSKSIELTIQKWKNTQNWWNCLIQGEKPIDTQKISPETSKLSDLDGEMKSTVEKMMFDMNQKQRGLPSSDELQKQEKLKEFMKAHPEMDFSKAKFS